MIATASSEEKRAVALRSGADEAIGYDEIDDLRVDVVVDPVGGEVFTRSLPTLNPLGSISRSGSRAACGRTRACSGSSVATPPSSASTSAG